jgi:glycosyltransferase involved in cell wall biosynthesis
MVRFSIIVPTYNRPVALARCLNSMLLLDYPESNWELIVVNDGGKPFGEDVRATLAQVPQTKIVSLAKSGPAVARNAGAKAARGNYLVFTDDDCAVTPKWLRQFELAFEKHHYDGVGGLSLNPYPDNIPASTWQHYLEFLIAFFHDNDGNALLLPTNNVAYRRSVFESLGGFDETFPLAAAEDIEFGYRLAGHGFRQVYDSAINVWHDHRSTYAGYLGQQFRYGRGGYYLSKVLWQVSYPHRVSRKKVRRLQFYGMLVRLLRQTRAPLRMWFLLGITPTVYGLGKRYEWLRSHLQAR